jgi:hypothetical protein
MRKSLGIVLIMAVVIICGGCASAGTKNNKTAGSAPAEEEYAPAASDESGNDGTNGIAEAAAQVRTVMKKAVDETADAVKESAKDFGHKANHYGKAAGSVIADDLSSAKDAVVAAVKGDNGKGKFPWWIIILIIIIIILLIYFNSGKKKG